MGSDAGRHARDIVLSALRLYESYTGARTVFHDNRALEIADKLWGKYWSRRIAQNPEGMPSYLILLYLARKILGYAKAYGVDLSKLDLDKLIDPDSPFDEAFKKVAKAIRELKTIPEEKAVNEFLGEIARIIGSLSRLIGFATPIRSDIERAIDDAILNAVEEAMNTGKPGLTIKDLTERVGETFLRIPISDLERSLNHLIEEGKLAKRGKYYIIPELDPFKRVMDVFKKVGIFKD